MHEAARDWIREVVREIGPGRRVLEVGPRGDPARALFAGAEYCGVDRLHGDGVDVMADGASWWPPPDRRPDRIACLEVLEHAPKPEGIVRHLWTVLQPDGWLLLTAAAPERVAHSGIDGGPLREGEHYAGVSPDAIRAWLQAPAPAYVMVVHDPVVGDVRVAARKPPRRERA